MLELFCEGLSETSPPIWATCLPQGELVSAGGYAKQQQQQWVLRHPSLTPGQPGLSGRAVRGWKRRGREGNTDFSFKAKGELCQLTVSACAGSLTWQWEQAAGDSRASFAAFFLRP